MTTLHCAAGCGQEFTDRSWLQIHYGMSDCGQMIYGRKGAAIRAAYEARLAARSHGERYAAERALVTLLREVQA